MLCTHTYKRFDLHRADDEGASAQESDSDAEDKPRTLLEASKELKKATEAMSARTQRLIKQKDEETRVLAEANQVHDRLPHCSAHSL